MPVKVVAITGSLRKASVNAGLLRAAAALAPTHDMEFNIVSADLPLYNGDLEESGAAGELHAPSFSHAAHPVSMNDFAGLPEPVKALRAQLAAADAIFFGVEEFNHSLSGDSCAAVPPVVGAETASFPCRINASTRVVQVFSRTPSRALAALMTPRRYSQPFASLACPRKRS